MRLVLGTVADDSLNLDGESHPYANYVVVEGVGSFEVVIPSSLQTGIKIIKGFDIVEGKVTNIVLDFDAKNSINQLGNGDYVMKPTITVIENEKTDEDEDEDEETEEETETEDETETV